MKLPKPYKAVRRKRGLPCLRDMQFVKESIKRFKHPFYGGQLTTYRQFHIRRYIAGELEESDVRLLRFERNLAVLGEMQRRFPVVTLDAQRMSELRHRTPL